MVSKKKKGEGEHPELRAALIDLKRYFAYAGLFSAAVNILMLVPVLYMLQVYDRVISSGSLSTLAMLTLLMVALLAAAGGFEAVRSGILIAASNRMENSLRRRVSDSAFKNTLMGDNLGTGTTAISDLTSLRQYVTSQGPIAFFDSPWVPIYIAVMFLFHPWFGVVAILAVVILLVITFTSEKITASKLKEANSLAGAANSQFTSSLRNAEVVAAMGMAENIRDRQDVYFNRVISLQSDASRKAGILGGLSKSLRMIMQSLVLGLGAFLALRQEISPGMMIAGSLLLGRALAPIDMLVSGWKGFSVARAQYGRLGELLDKQPQAADAMSLPPPEGALSAENVVVVPPGAKAPVVKGVSFALRPGEALGIVGPSASGKSTLARALLGIWPTVAGKVRLDGADISAWNRSELGPYIGYLPQDIELFNGTISENICRFGEVESDKVVAAAKISGVHEMILHLPDGYDTRISASSGILSGGQRQRVALARAVYGKPRLLMLDEPNSNLDDQGERELAEALKRIKAAGCTIVVITHRTMVLQCVDHIMVMKDGAIANFGNKNEILASLIGPAQTQARATG